MPREITSLTQEQIDAMKPHAEKWGKIALSCEPADWELFDKSMPVCFQEAGLTYPYPRNGPHAVRVASPGIGHQVASKAGMLVTDDALLRKFVERVKAGETGSPVMAIAAGATRRRAIAGHVLDCLGPELRKQTARRMGCSFSDVSRLWTDFVHELTGPWHAWLAGQFAAGSWWGSPALVDYFRTVCDLELTPRMARLADAYKGVGMSVSCVWPNEHFVIASDRPEQISLDERGNPHCPDGPAVRWRDGWGLYYVHDVFFSPDDWDRLRHLPIIELAKAKNVDQRAALLKLHGPDEICRAVRDQAELIDRGSVTREGGAELAYELYAVRNLTDRVEKLLVYRCASTDKIYTAFVPNEFTDAVAAAAWKHRKTKEEYQAVRHQA